jgi:hypothetical protein
MYEFLFKDTSPREPSLSDKPSVLLHEASTGFIETFPAMPPVFNPASIRCMSAVLKVTRPSTALLRLGTQFRTVNAKRSAPRSVCYLEKPEIDALLEAPSPGTKLGCRDRALLLFLYNSGARAEEAAKLCIEDLSLHSGADGTLLRCAFTAKAARFASARSEPLQPIH